MAPAQKYDAGEVLADPCPGQRETPLTTQGMSAGPPLLGGDRVEVQGSGSTVAHLMALDLPAERKNLPIWTKGAVAVNDSTAIALGRQGELLAMWGARGAAWVPGEVLGRVRTQGAPASPAQPGPAVLSFPDPIPCRGRAASAGFPSPRASYDLAWTPASLSHPAVRRPCHGLHTLPSRPFPPASKPHWERSRPFLALPSSSQHTDHTGPVQCHARLNTLTPAPELTVLSQIPERGCQMQPLLKALGTVSPHPPLTTPRARGIRPRLCSQCRSGPPNPSPRFISPRDRSNSAP